MNLLDYLSSDKTLNILKTFLRAIETTCRVVFSETSVLKKQYLILLKKLMN